MTASPDQFEERLPRNLGPWSAAAVLIGTTIGSGIFRVPSEVARSLGAAGPMLLVWVIGGAVTLTGALTIAELAAAYPRSGGIFAYILEAEGRFAAFLYGWAELTVFRAAAVGGIASIFAKYLGQFVAMTDMQERYVAAVIIVVIAFLNYVGVSYASALMNVTTVLKYGALLGLALFAFTSGNGSTSHFTEVGRVVTVSAMLTALVPVLWTYDGWSNLSFAGGEVKNPGRSLPIALIYGTASIIVIYLLVNAAYLYLLPVSGIAGAERVAATAAEHIPAFGRAGAAVVAGVVMLSCFGSVNGSLLTGPRVLFAMSDRKLFFPIISRVSPRFQTPSVAIWLAAALAVTYVLQNSFAQLADRFILGTWPFYAMAVAGVYILRRRQPDVPRPYRTWGYPVTPALFLVASVGMVVNAIVTNPHDTGVTFGIILAGIPAYGLWLLWQRMRPEA
ncbi:MAG TPA: amino acid permease [Gemmatimonadales bacterium]|nr:amino acid permease [Gemmatimonadales bacterium]